MMLRPCVAVSSDLESRIPAGDGMGWDGMADKLVVSHRQQETQKREGSIRSC